MDLLNGGNCVTISQVSIFTRLGNRWKALVGLTGEGLEGMCGSSTLNRAAAGPPRPAQVALWMAVVLTCLPPSLSPLLPAIAASLPNSSAPCGSGPPVLTLRGDRRGQSACFTPTGHHVCFKTGTGPKPEPPQSL